VSTGRSGQHAGPLPVIPMLSTDPPAGVLDGPPRDA
jgi:hypothetical protein